MPTLLPLDLAAISLSFIAARTNLKVEVVFLSLFLIDSFNLSKIYKFGWKLVILGKGPQEKFLKKKVKNLKLINKVLFKGFKDPMPWYKKSKISSRKSRGY